MALMHSSIVMSWPHSSQIKHEEQPQRDKDKVQDRNAQRRRGQATSARTPTGDHADDQRRRPHEQAVDAGEAEEAAGGVEMMLGSSRTCQLIIAVCDVRRRRAAV
jgi:hypothetical protein